ncbi:hypothetical protein BU24DRAFT_494831 [Aaosphaeria arxii CBS 175.79]|uniref:Zn(2)-C6 fungal-type domain-containing protein n=1 Tax=Aaosphaeria arxii CBS 175.79 TaxID=1450172 RepID=A0A6A5XI24_9PLEO|nr:uncharacterized protein BU24DRAFT_494831 [Aaosphaeria arxii CBS 175.79]KAF2012915.1 hypothetical protein BU24DRAFT_494831 [Aaosphaeria arxii CBS 175.79]
MPGAQQRACDRCAELKVQCSEDAPCARCRRLSLQCTRNRPVRARGRPRKHVSPAHAGHQLSPVCNSPTATSSEVDGHLDVQDAPCSSTLSTVDDALAVSPRDVFALVYRIGILSAFRQNEYESLIASVDGSFLANDAMHATLLVCAALLCQSVEDDQTYPEQSRARALADIAALLAESRPVHRTDVYCLYLLANLCYLHEQSTAMALRWTTLANCFFSINVSCPMTQPLISNEVDRRLASLLSIDNNVQMLLYNRSCSESFTRHGTELFQPQLSDHDWHNTIPGTAEGVIFPHTLEGFFELFLPLQNSFKGALSYPTYDSSSYKAIVDELEQYFIQFPNRIADFQNVSLLWQFEAMIWFHGIHILLNARADFLELLLDSAFTGSPTYTNAADHALLMGDILKALLASLAFVPQQLNHATIFFIALSSAMHASLLSAVLLEGLSTPEVLLQSAIAHYDILEAILRHSRSCDHPLIIIVSKILALNISRAGGSSTDYESDLGGFLQGWKYYRWIAGGHGLNKIDEGLADELLSSTMQRFRYDLTVSRLSPSLISLFDPDQRICRPGTFDLSILY